jgi:hypothetical protein
VGCIAPRISSAVTWSWSSKIPAWLASQIIGKRGSAITVPQDVRSKWGLSLETASQKSRSGSGSVIGERA